MAICDTGYQVIDIKHGSEELAYPRTFAVDESSTDLIIRAGTIVGVPCRPTIARDLQAVCECLEYAMDIPHGTKDNLVIRLKQADGGTTTVTLADMKLTGVTLNGDAPPYSRTVSFAIENDFSSEPLKLRWDDEEAFRGSTALYLGCFIDPKAS